MDQLNAAGLARIPLLTYVLQQPDGVPDMYVTCLPAEKSLCVWKVLPRPLQIGLSLDMKVLTYRLYSYVEPA